MKKIERIYMIIKDAFIQYWANETIYKLHLQTFQITYLEFEFIPHAIVPMCWPLWFQLGNNLYLEHVGD
jgi:hypothetical protein